VEGRTLQPVLRWPPVSHPRGAAAADTGQGDGSRVTYDLRVWRADNGYPVTLVYERTALPESSHRIEEALEPSTDYVWSVRGRFLVDGHVRVSDWSLLQAPRLPLVPHPFLRRFRTPPS
jgi:hypothetical protein